MRTVVFNFKRVTAREVAAFNAALKNNPESNVATLADFFSKVVVKMEDSEKEYFDLGKPDTYLDLPYWGSEDQLSYSYIMERLETEMGKLGQGQRKNT